MTVPQKIRDIKAEMELRCNEGLPGPIHSHSLYCRCKQLTRKIQQLKFNTKKPLHVAV